MPRKILTEYLMDLNPISISIDRYRYASIYLSSIYLSTYLSIYRENEGDGLVKYTNRCIYFISVGYFVFGK